MLKNKKGITLIALVVTIVVLLILAGVTINLLLDEIALLSLLFSNLSSESKGILPTKTS